MMALLKTNGMRMEKLDPKQNGSEEYVSPLDYLQVILRWRRMIAGLVLGACLVAVGVSLVLPKAYQARATILPPENRASTFGLNALLSNTNLPLSGLGIPELSSTSDLFVQILKSRTIAERVINQFHLINVYQSRNMEEAIKQLQRDAKFTAQKAGVISIDVEAPTARLAAGIANAFVNELDRFNQENNMTAAKSTRLFIEQRLNEAKQDMSKALVALQTFQEQNQVVSLTEQAKAAVDAAAGVETQLRFLEFELAVKRKTLYPTHSEVIQTQTQIEELRKQLNRLKFGDRTAVSSSAVANPNATELHIPFARMPALQLQLGQLMMDVKVQQAIVEMLFQQYEQAKIQEIRDTPTVRRLDTAVPPKTRSKPLRVYIIITTGVLSLFLGVMLAFLLEYGRKAAHHGEDAQKIEQMASLLRHDYSQLKQLFNGKQVVQPSPPPATSQEQSPYDVNRPER